MAILQMYLPTNTNQIPLFNFVHFMTKASCVNKITEIPLDIFTIFYFIINVKISFLLQYLVSFQCPPPKRKHVTCFILSYIFCMIDF